MESNGLVSKLWAAVPQLVDAGIPAVQRPFGFSVIFQDRKGNTTAECGVEHDGSISISIQEKQPPTLWFFRNSVPEMINFLIKAKHYFESDKSSTWLEALQAVDDTNESDKMI